MRSRPRFRVVGRGKVAGATEISSSHSPSPSSSRCSSRISRLSEWAVLLPLIKVNGFAAGGCFPTDLIQRTNQGSSRRKGRKCPPSPTKKGKTTVIRLAQPQSPSASVGRLAPPPCHASRIPGRSGERKEGRREGRVYGPTAEPPTSHYLLRARHYRIAFH